LIGFLATIRGTERSRTSEVGTPAFEAWREPRVQAAGLITASVATGLGVGFGIDQSVIDHFSGVLVAAGL
jgi:hypothetical protein